MTPDEFQKVARDTALYIQDTQDIIDNLQSENAELRKQAAKTQKTASASPALDADGVENMVDNLVSAGHLKEAARQQAIDAITADPNALVGFVDKLATQSMQKQASETLRPLGRAHSTNDRRSANAERESDAQYQSLMRNLRSKQ